MRPGRIEVHVDGERTGPPDRDSGDEGSSFADVFFGEAEGEQKTEETVESRGDGHGVTVRRGKSIGCKLGTESAGNENAGVGGDEKRTPENSGADGKMILEMAGLRSETILWRTIFIQAGFAKGGVGALIVLVKVEVMLDEQGTGERVISDAVPAYPRIE